MKLEKLIEILESQYPKASADLEDYIGLQSEGKKEVKNILITLDLTLDVVNQAIEKNIDTIITHHPFIFGDKIEELEKNAFLRAKKELIEKLNINVFVIHTNADWNPESIAWATAMGLGLKKINQLHNNFGVQGTYESRISLIEIAENIRKIFSLNYDFRTNRERMETFNKIIIGSGASGSLINYNEAKGSLLIIGEVKHHEWVAANENNISVLEIGHYSEIIFKEMVKMFLQEKGLNVITSVESNGYKTI